MDELWRENNVFYNLLCFVITENEKLFDRSDANLYWRTVFHVFGVAHHAYIAMTAGLLSLRILNHGDFNVQSLYTFRAAYLTGWNFVFQTIFLGISLGHDVLEWLDKQDTVRGTKLRYWKNVLFNGIVLPYSLFVTSMFWCVYAIDRELVYPKIYDEVVPWWFNHCVHTNITIMIVIETFLQARRHPTDEKLETIFNLAVGFSYAIVYYSIFYFTGRWLYRVFGVMTWWQVCLFQLLIWSSCYFFYRISFPINRLIHSSDDVVVDKEIKDIKKDNGMPNNDTNGVNGINEPNGTSHVNSRNSTNGIDNGSNGEIVTNLKTSPETNGSWSVKYRASRNQSEKSQL